MNIIVSKDKSIRLTQYSSQSTYNFTDINFYISKDLKDFTPSVKLKKNRNIYSFDLQLDAVATNYNIYKVIFTQTTILSAREYDLIVVLGTQELAVNSVKLNAINYISSIATVALDEVETYAEADDPITYPYGLTDEHEPVDIVDRDIIISKNQNVLVAEDNISQCIRFRLTRYYDGIDLYDKYLFIDYIGDDKKIFNIYIPKECIDLETLPGDSNEYIVIKWAVPYQITKNAGTVSFAISAIDLAASSGAGDDIEPKSQYIWQTKPSKLMITSNLGRRNAAPEQEDGNSSVNTVVLMQMIEENTKAIEEIQNSDIYSLDINSEDGQVILTGGGAAGGDI